METVVIDQTIGGGEVAPGLRGMFLQLKVGAVTDGDQNIQFRHEFISALGENTDSVTFSIYYKGEKPLEFTVAAKFKKNGSLISNLATVKLQPNSMNKVTLPNIYGIQWSRYEAIDYLLFYYEDGGGVANDGVYLFDTIVNER